MTRAIYKSARFLSTTIDKVMMLVFVVVLLIGAYIFLDSAYVFYDANPQSLAFIRTITQKDEEVTYTLDDLSDEAVAWITIYGTNINYPIMHCTDNNNKYLNMNPLGKYSLAGSIFMDCRNSADFSDPYVLVYGHHMSSGYMFGALDAYEDVNYMLEHQWGKLTLRDGREFDLFVHSFAALDVSVEEVFTPSKMHDIENFIFENTIYNADHGDGPTMALTTCRSPGETMRTIVFCEICGQTTKPISLD